MLCRLIQYVEHNKCVERFDPQRIWKYIKCLEAQRNVYFFFLCGKKKTFCGGLCLATLNFGFVGLRIQVSFSFVKIY